VGDLAREEEGGGIAENDGKNGHKCKGTNCTGEHHAWAALHGKERGDEERFVADFADDDSAEALQEGIHDGSIPDAAL